MSHKKNYIKLILFLIVVIVSGSYIYFKIIKPENVDYPNNSGVITPPFGPVQLGTCLGKTTKVGSIVLVNVSVTQYNEPNSAGYGIVYGISYLNRSRTENVSLIDSENRFLSYPLNLNTNNITLELNQVLDSKEICLKGGLYNCSAGDGSWFLALKIENQHIYSVKKDPQILTGSQVEFYTDSVYYHVNDTARVTVRNLSEDWLGTGRHLTLFKEVNGTWIQTQPYPSDYSVTNELVSFFPGTSWSHNLPLYHLSPGNYRLVKQVRHSASNIIAVETFFTIKMSS